LPLPKAGWPHRPAPGRGRGGGWNRSLNYSVQFTHFAARLQAAILRQNNGQKKGRNRWFHATRLVNEVGRGLASPWPCVYDMCKELETGVSNPESFIEEVTDEVRRDRLFAIFRKYGWIGIVLVLAIVGGTAYTEWDKARHQAEAVTFGDALMDALDEADPQARRAALIAAETVTDGDAEKLALQKLLLASDPQENREASLTALAAVIADQNVSPMYRDLAVLRQVILSGSDMEIGARRAALDPLAIPGRPFRTLALEQLAYLSVESGDIEAAITQLRSVSADQEAPAGLRQRASQMIVALGGESAQG
jgi:hypothetical protein